MLTAVVGSALANKPGNGGAAWVPLTWARGLSAMGIDTYLVEEIDSATCVDGAGSPSSLDGSTNLAFFRDATAAVGLEQRAVLIGDDGVETHGASFDDVATLAADADFVVNISGHLRSAPFLARAHRKIYLDLDPGYTQFWHMNGMSVGLEGHEAFFTVGENVGRPHCSIPDTGIRWQTTRQPVIMSDWPVESARNRDLFTTVASWRGAYGAVDHAGRRYGPKAREFRKFVGVPDQCEQSFEIALEIHPADAADLHLLRGHGWSVVDPTAVASDPGRFRAYVQQSGAEFSVAQGVYVDTVSGWFSDRSVRYLASGKPVVVQDTGFSLNYPVGRGLLCFSTLEQAAHGCSEIAGDYDEHCAAARQLAEDLFDHECVLGRFLDDAGISG